MVDLRQSRETMLGRSELMAKRMVQQQGYAEMEKNDP